MISKNVYKFCCEDISLIENYEEAVNSNLQYDCHHRLEIKEDGTTVRMEELKEQGLYFNRPASELIFLERYAHKILHSKHPIPDSEKTKRKKSESAIKRLQKMTKEEKREMYGTEMTPELRKRIGESVRKRFAEMTPEERKKKFGHSYTEERRKHLSEKMKGRKFSEEHKRKISEFYKNHHPRKGIKVSEEIKANMRAGHKKRHWKLVDGHRVWW